MVKKKKDPADKKKSVTNGSSNNEEKAVDVAMQAVRKQFGDTAVGWLSGVPTTTDVIPTGSVGLDSALGVGGIARGRIYELYGPPSSGKSTLTFSLMRQAIAKGQKVVFVDAEHSLSTKLLVDMGIDLDKVAIVDAYTAEDNLDAVGILLGTGVFSLCVIDSISALQPTAEANLSSFSDNTMGIHPKLMARMCREFVPLAFKTKTALVLINQIRANLGYGAPETTSGGFALQHSYSGRIRVSGGGLKSKQFFHPDTGEVQGHRVTLEVTKNKLGPPFRSAEIDLVYGKGFDSAGEVLDLSVDMGLVSQSGSWFSYGENKIGHGRLKAVSYLRQNGHVMDELDKKVRVMLGLISEDE
jgi:recombination protein RecA